MKVATMTGLSPEVPARGSLAPGLAPGLAPCIVKVHQEQKLEQEQDRTGAGTVAPGNMTGLLKLHFSPNMAVNITCSNARCAAQ